MAGALVFMVGFLKFDSPILFVMRPICRTREKRPLKAMCSHARLCLLLIWALTVARRNWGKLFLSKWDLYFFKLNITNVFLPMRFNIWSLLPCCVVWIPLVMSHCKMDVPFPLMPDILDLMDWSSVLEGACPLHLLIMRYTVSFSFFLLEGGMWAKIDHRRVSCDFMRNMAYDLKKSELQEKEIQSLQCETWIYWFSWTSWCSMTLPFCT